ncbi:pre-mRNA splicing factor component-domain-containing protein [Sparassis latifolia]
MVRIIIKGVHPSIKKTEWSKTEDEKLLHLAKLMPTQWRTIAPIVGRTATQCLERYQKLLDEAEAKENEELGLAGPGDEAGPSADDVRRLRPGEIDPDPETKPARPDPIDMDEDEKEMLSEARARLANTQGKKAKRKARERQLEEARRLAVLQKKRELKAAGIIQEEGMDYNADIPFEKKAAPGFYDTSDEQARATTAPVGQTLHDNVMSEARNLRNMIIAQTPLLRRTGFEGATPRHQIQATPGSTLMRTPMRDTLSINPEGYSAVGETPRDQRLRTTSAKRALKAGFMSLPKPENNFELLVPEDEEVEETEGVMAEEDSGDRDARLKQLREEEERKALARRTQVVQRGLPRPATVDVVRLLEDLSITESEGAELAPAEKLVHAELADLLQHDSIAHPIPGTSRPGGTLSTYVIPGDDDIAAAKSAIYAEFATSLGYPDAKEEQLKQGVTVLAGLEEVDDTLSWPHIRRQLVFDASSRIWVEPSSLPVVARIAGFSVLLDECRETMTKEAGKAAKAEKKLNVTLGGYESRSKGLSKRITDAFSEMQKVKVDYESFVRLRTNESATGPGRASALKEEVEKLERRERLLQERYAELEAERRESQARVAVLEERVMAEAEALNEAALAEVEEA